MNAHLVTQIYHEALVQLRAAEELLKLATYSLDAIDAVDAKVAARGARSIRESVKELDKEVWNLYVSSRGDS